MKNKSLPPFAILILAFSLLFNFSSVSAQSIYKVPVVIHYIYNPAGTVRTDAELMDDLKSLNEDFNKMNPDFPNTPAFFQPLIGNAQIQFCLAVQDPDGMPSNGILRNATTVSTFNSATDSIKESSKGGMDGWSKNNYLNIWIVGDGINLTDGNNNDISGYTTPPGTAVEPYDGVVVNYFSLNADHELTNQVAKWLGLNDIWGTDTTCNDDDGINDTPQQSAPDTTVAISFPQTAKLCNIADVSEMYCNFMEDRNFARCMFTVQQVNAMRATLESGGLRHSILSSHGGELVVNNAPASQGFFNLANANGTVNNSFRHVAVDRKGNVWVGSNGFGFFLYQNGTWSPDPAHPTMNVRSIISGNVNNDVNLGDPITGDEIFIAEGDGGIQALAGGVYFFSPDNSNIFASFKWDSHYAFDPNNIFQPCRCLHDDVTLWSRLVNSMTSADNGNLFVACGQTLFDTTYDGGLNVWFNQGQPNPGPTSIFTGTPSTDIRALQAGCVGDEVWFGFDRSCPSTCNSSYFVRFSKAGNFLSFIDNAATGLPLNTSGIPSPRGISGDENGWTYLALSGGSGVYGRPNGTPNSPFTAITSGTCNSNAIATNKYKGKFLGAPRSNFSQTIWVGTQSGLLKIIDGHVVNTFTTAQGLPSNNVTGIAIDSANNKWITTDAGIYFFKNEMFNINPSVSFNSGANSYDVTVNTNGGVAPFTFELDTTLQINNPDYTGIQPGVHTILVTDAHSEESWFQFVISCTLSESIIANPGLSFCLGDSIHLVAGGTGVSDYQWSNGATSQIITVNTQGTYAVTVTNGACSASDSKTVTVNNAHPVISSSDGNPICPNGSTTLDAGAGFNSYLWSTGASTQTVTVTVPTSYQVTVTSNGCSGKDSVTLSQYNCLAPTPVIFNNITTTGVKIVWTQTPCGEAYKVQIRPTGSTIWTTYNVPGYYGYKVLTNLTSETAYDVRIKTFCAVNAGFSSFSPIQTFTTSFSCATPIITVANFTSTQVVFNWNAVPGATSYIIRLRKQGTTQWSHKLVNAPATTVTFNGLTPSTTYQYRGITSCNSSGSPLSILSPIQTFTSALRSEEVADVTTDILSSENEILIYPNPASTNLYFEFYNDAATVTAKILLLNELGQQLQTKSITLDENGVAVGNFDISSYSPGLYLLMIRTGNDEIQSKKFVKE